MYSSSRRDFLKYTGTLSGAALLTPESIYANDIAKHLNAAQNKAIAQIWQSEKMRADVTLALGSKYDNDLLKSLGSWSHSNRKAVLNEIIKLYRVDLSKLEDTTLLYSTEQILSMQSGEFASTPLQNRYDSLVKEGSKSITDGLKVIVKLSVEAIDEALRYKAIFNTQAKVKENITYLADNGMNHYWALDAELINKGVVTGCCAVGAKYCKNAKEYPRAFGLDHINSSKPISNEMRHALAHMWSEEKMAHDAFEVVYSVYPHLRLFYNIGHWSETQHKTAVEELIAFYNIDVTDYTQTSKHYDKTKLDAMGPGDYAIEDFESRYQNVLLPYAVQSDIKALQLGCMVEVQDIRDLTGFLQQNDGNKYIEQTFKYLIAGSQSHYWAYHYALIERGITNGCCSAGQDYCKSAAEYPSGNGNQELAWLWWHRDKKNIIC
jgi:hypothetical protein